MSINRKHAYRQQALARRRALSPATHRQASELIIQKLFTHLSASPELLQAPRLIYRSFSDEVETTSLFSPDDSPECQRIYAPVTHAADHLAWHRIAPGTRWQRGAFGILEPDGGMLWSDKDGAAVLLCPLVGFDRSGNRLGLGKGCFDRWLASAKDHMLQTIGLAFACQECPPIPAEKHDIALDFIITEGEIISCRSN